MRSQTNNNIHAVIIVDEIGVIGSESESFELQISDIFLAENGSSHRDLQHLMTNHVCRSRRVGSVKGFAFEVEVSHDRKQVGRVEGGRCGGGDGG